MRTADDLRGILQRIDGKGYKAYKDIKDRYDYGNYILCVDHVQGDPFALPSKLRVMIPQEITELQGDMYSNESREVALRDFLTEGFLRQHENSVRGTEERGKAV
jgi:predicted ABC-class ATPase